MSFRESVLYAGVVFNGSIGGFQPFSFGEYHPDTYNGWSVHAYFRRDLNRKHRSKNKAILHCAVRDFNDEPMFIPDYNTVEWEYW